MLRNRLLSECLREDGESFEGEPRKLLLTLTLVYIFVAAHSMLRQLCVTPDEIVSCLQSCAALNSAIYGHCAIRRQLGKCKVLVSTDSHKRTDVSTCARDTNRSLCVTSDSDINFQGMFVLNKALLALFRVS